MALRPVKVPWVVLLLGACTPPAAERSSASGPSAHGSALATAADAGPPTAWQLTCAEELRLARKPAAAVNAELAWAAVKTDRRGDGREQVVLHAFPPIWKTPGLHLVVERGAPDGELHAGDQQWQRFAELFHGSTFTTIFRRTERFQASLAFDGWQVGDVDRLAPVLCAAADRCFVEPPADAGPGETGTVPPPAGPTPAADSGLEALVSKPLGDGFLLLDDGLLLDSQAPFVALLVPAAAAPRFYGQEHGPAEGYWTPGVGELLTLADALRTRRWTDHPRIGGRLHQTRFQVVGIVQGTKRLLFANGFCRAPESWQRAPVVVDDGGDCYFQISYDAAARVVVRLTVNGEG